MGEGYGSPEHRGICLQQGVAGLSNLRHIGKRCRLHRPGINYKDSFLTAEEFAWETKHGRDFNSPEVKAMDKQQALGLRLPLFVKKHDDEGHSFYYMGDMTFLRKELREKLTGTRGNRPIVAMWFRMQKRVEESLYRYLTGI